MAEVRHRGEVRRVEAGMVYVAIVASGACHSCRAREMCGMSETSEKIIEVRTAEASSFAVGDEVMVAEEQRMALKAVLVAYVGALVALLALLIGSLALGLKEGWAALISIAGLALYYGGVYLLRDKIEKTIHFTITKN